MERLTTRHCGVAVIKNKSKLKEAMEKLAAYEDAEDKKVRCKPGDMIWHIECDQYYGTLFMAECGDYIISCSEELLYENNFERQLEEMCFESLDFDGVSVYIHAKENVFFDKEEAEQALARMEKSHE